MSVFLQLIKITSSSVEPSGTEKKKSKAFGKVMGILIFLLIFLPVAVFTGFIVFALTNAMLQLSQTMNSEQAYMTCIAQGLNFMLYIVALFSFIFGFNVVLSVFYFSSDLNYLLPLPVSPMKIIGAKLTSTMISENVMEGILVFSAIGGFLTSYFMDKTHLVFGPGIISIISGIIGILTFPVVPICYCAVICLLLMYFTKFIRNKDTVSKVTSLSMVALLAALIIFLNVSGGFDVNAFSQQLASGENYGLFYVLDIIFFHVHFLSRAVMGDFLSLLIYLIINAASVAVVLLLSSKMYIKAVTGLNNSQGKMQKNAGSLLDRKIKSSSQFAAYFKKELLILVRTPAYLSNCVAINLIWPVFIYLFIILQSQSNFLGSYLDRLNSGDNSAVLTLILVVFGVSVILTALNCIASSAITREGNHFEIMKYLPIDLMTQINSKALVSIAISGTGLIIYIISAFIVLGVNPVLIAYSVVLSLFSVIFTAYLGIYLDTMNPKLVWEDEINALRGNYHVFYNMALALIITAGICAATKLLFNFGIMSFSVILVILLIINVLLAAGCYLLCKKKGTKNLMSIEM